MSLDYEEDYIFQELSQQLSPASTTSPTQISTTNSVSIQPAALPTSIGDSSCSDSASISQPAPPSSTGPTCFVSAIHASTSSTPPEPLDTTPLSNSATVSMSTMEEVVDKLINKQKVHM